MLYNAILTSDNAILDSALRACCNVVGCQVPFSIASKIRDHFHGDDDEPVPDMELIMLPQKQLFMCLVDCLEHLFIPSELPFILYYQLTILVSKHHHVRSKV